MKLYHNIQIGSLTQSKNNRVSNLIFFSGTEDRELTEFINLNIFSTSYFRAIYVPKWYKTQRLGKKVVVDQKLYYDNIQAKCPNIILARRNIVEYRNKNLIFDIIGEYNANKTEIKVRGKERVGHYINMLTERIKEGSTYSNRIVVIPTPSNIQVSDLTNLNTIDNPFSFIYSAFKRKLLSPEQQKALEGVQFMFYAPTKKAFVKFTYKTEMSDSEISRLLRCMTFLVKIERNEDVSNEKDIAPSNGDESIDKESMKKETVAKNISSKIFKSLNANDDLSNTDVVIGIKDKIEDQIRASLDNIEIGDKSEEELLDEIEKANGEVVNSVNELKEVQKAGTDNVEQKRVTDNLKDKQKNVEMNGSSIQDIIDDFKSSSIDVTMIKNETITNNEVKKSNLRDFDLSYMNKQMKKDLISVISAFNKDSDVQLYINDIKSEETSDDLTKKMTYTISFRDSNKVSHTIKVNYPILDDGRFMFINGGKKLILKQILLLPIVKTKPDTVQITTNYNKFFVTRFGRKLTQRTERLKKFFASDVSEFNTKGKKFKAKQGNALTINSKYETTLEYNELSSFLLEIETDDLILVFDQKELRSRLNGDMNNPIKLNSELTGVEFESDIHLPIGYYKKSNEVLLMSIVDKSFTAINKKNVKRNLDFYDLSDLIINLMTNELGESAVQKLESFSNTKTLMYSRVKINSKMIPLIVLLGYELGLINVLKRYNIEYQFSEKNIRINPLQGQSKIRFADGYLIYNSKQIRNTLLLDGLSVMPTEDINFNDMNVQETYLETFLELFGSRNMGKGFHNTLSLMVDPITLDVLKQLRLPENIYDILLYANTLLEDSTYKRLNDMSSYRIRCAEQVNAYFYKILADSFKEYKDTMKAGNPHKMSIPPDALIRTLLESPTVDEYSTLNPSLEIEKIGAATFKGLNGINMDAAFTTEVRAYHPSMKGIFALSTPDSDKVGVVRQLSYDPGIKNTRGFLDTDRNTKNTSSNIYGPAELLSSFTARHADPPRIGMQTTQQKHIVPVKVQTKPLFGSGVERTIAHLLSDDFVFRSKKAGMVEKVDDELQVAILKYDDGTKDYIDLSEKLNKNSNGGFFVVNKKKLVVKQGDKFDIGTVLAKDPSYFIGNNPHNIAYTTGKLSKVAIASGDFTYEDSSIVTENLSNDLSTNITMKKEIVLGTNATIDYIVKKGDKIKTGDALITFENSFEDDSLNDLLDKLGDEMHEAISDMSKNKLTSKYTGKIVDVVIYYNRDIEEFSPSIQKLIKDYVKLHSKRKNLIQTEAPHNVVKTAAINKQTTSKIKGVEVDGIMIEIYIEYEDDLSIGDKITFYTALKSIISDVIPKGEEPFSESREDEKIEAVISPLSIVSRMTTDVYNALYLSKVIIELKEAVRRMR